MPKMISWKGTPIWIASLLATATMVILLSVHQTQSGEAIIRSLKPSASDYVRYTTDGKMIMPIDYREWVFLTSGVNMSYNEQANESSETVFDNVFVNPSAYASFKKTGTWPDKTVFVLEIREGVGKGSINKTGKFQTPRISALEVHVKDEARFPGKWAFFNFDVDKPQPATVIPRTVQCYACHEQHAAVDTTFVQFYPTLLPIAREYKSFSKAYLNEEKAQH